MAAGDGGWISPSEAAEEWDTPPSIYDVAFKRPEMIVRREVPLHRFPLQLDPPPRKVVTRAERESARRRRRSNWRAEFTLATIAGWLVGGIAIGITWFIVAAFNEGITS